jgi:non-ribosomal peptide synthetase component F
MMTYLHGGLERATEHWPDRIAVEEPGGPAVTYRELSALSDRVRDRLAHMGVRRGDRVGVYMRKCVDTVATIFGALKAGAAYVPVDPDAPPARCAYILNNCSVRVIVTESRLAEQLRAELQTLGDVPPMLLLADAAGGLALPALLAELDQQDAAPAVATVQSDADDLAYILYTSGSTGRPKGVMLTHQCGTSYVDWCTETFDPTEQDCFSSHAPFHFDLSILDIYVPLKHGARLVLIGEALGKEPVQLAQVIAEQRISVWYSVPSILNMMAQYGRLDATITVRCVSCCMPAKCFLCRSCAR